MARQQTRRRIELGWFEAAVLAIGYVASLGIVGLGGFLIGQRTVPNTSGGRSDCFGFPYPPAAEVQGETWAMRSRR